MKKALKIGAGIIGGGYLCYYSMLAGMSLLMYTALRDGRVREANAISATAWVAIGDKDTANMVTDTANMLVRVFTNKNYVYHRR